MDHEDKKLIEEAQRLLQYKSYDSMYQAKDLLDAIAAKLWLKRNGVFTREEPRDIPETKSKVGYHE